MVEKSAASAPMRQHRRHRSHQRLRRVACARWPGRRSAALSQSVSREGSGIKALMVGSRNATASSHRHTASRQHARHDIGQPGGLGNRDRLVLARLIEPSDPFLARKRLLHAQKCPFGIATACHCKINLCCRAAACVPALPAHSAITKARQKAFAPTRFASPANRHAAEAERVRLSRTCRDPGDEP
jgi:hypothetical protein